MDSGTRSVIIARAIERKEVRAYSPTEPPRSAGDSLSATLADRSREGIPDGRSLWRDGRQFIDPLSGGTLLDGERWPGRDPRRIDWVRLKRVLDYIDSNLGGNIHLSELAEAAGLSEFHFAKLFKQSMGASPHQYILQRRLERAKELLRNPALSLSDISLEAGFADQSHFTNVFRRFVGATPSKFRSTL